MIIKKIFCIAVISTFAGVILYGSGTIQAVNFEEIDSSKMYTITYVSNNASFLAPMPIEYVVSPCVSNEPFSFCSMQSHDSLFQRMVCKE